MFTVEFDHDDTEITIMDEYAFNEDVKINAFDDIVFIRQWDEDKNAFDIIAMSPDMWEDLIVALNSPEGIFKRVRKKLTA
jgi:hypothetical protein